MRCPICERAHLIPDSVLPTTISWKGNYTIIQCHGDLCPYCGEIILSKDEKDRIDEEINIFKRTFNSKHLVVL